MDSTKSTPSKAKSVIMTIINILLWIIVVIAAFFTVLSFTAKSSKGYASILGTILMPVQSDSMVPVFKKGDLIVVHELSYSQASALDTDDIVTFRVEIGGTSAFNTHRIVDALKDTSVVQYVTKGDNNDVADTGYIGPGDIIGKYVFAIPFLGSVLDFLSGTVGFLVVILIPLLLFFAFQIYKLICVFIEMRKVTALEAAEEAASKQRSEIEAEMRAKIEAEMREKAADAKSDKAEGDTPESKSDSSDSSDSSDNSEKQ